MIKKSDLERYWVGHPGPGLLLSPFEFDADSHPQIKQWFDAFRKLPSMRRSDTGVSGALAQLPDFPVIPDRYTNPETGTANLLADRIMLAAFASAYLNFQDDIYNTEGIAVLPQKIAVPLATLSEQLGLPPFIAYSDYVLANMGNELRYDPRGLPSIPDIELQFPFMGTENERAFIGIHHAIEAVAGKMLSRIPEILAAAKDRNDGSLTQELHHVANTLTRMREIFETIPDHCDPERYNEDTRPFIMGIKFNPRFEEGVIYEGVFDNQPQFFRGQTGGQTPTIPIIDALLRVVHMDKGEQNYDAYDEFRGGMLPQHRAFIHDVGYFSEVRAAAAEGSQELRNAYNAAITELAAFRTFHKTNATDVYLKDTLTGTGGSALETYLRAHEDHTRGTALSGGRYG